MPCNSIVVYIIKYTEAGFGGAVDVELSVIRLALLLVASLRPRVVAPAIRNLK